MVDLSEFRATDRPKARALFGVAGDAPVIGWVGRLDRKKRVEDFVRAAAVVAKARPAARFVVIGGPDAFMPDYAQELRHLAVSLGLAARLAFLGDRADVPALLAGLDLFVWLSRHEGMPHVIAEAGAAGLAVVATRDNGTLEQIEDGVSGVFVPHQDPDAVAAAILRLIDDPAERHRLGGALRAKVGRDYAVAAIAPQWRAMFDAVLAERRPAPPPSLFQSFFQGGIESSTHRRHDGRRLDMIAAIGHDRHAASDYRTLASHAIRTVRDGLRWHLIETSPGRYDWSSFLPMLHAARETGTQVLWDLLHYGWPDDLDIWRPAFVDRFARFAAAAARVVRDETDAVPFYCPVNEVSFFAWGGGDAAYLNPFARGRGHELKVQLARTAIAAMDAIWAVDPRARFVHADPVINVITHPERPHEHPHAEGHRQAQFQGWDMIAGRAWPQLGGTPKHLDIVGVNYYFNNQWIHGTGPIDVGHPLHRPFRYLLADTYARYGRPIFVAETGIEAERRPSWLAQIGAEVRAARVAGVPVEGLCLYPVINHPGWDDERHCPERPPRPAAALRWPAGLPTACRRTDAAEGFVRVRAACGLSWLHRACFDGPFGPLGKSRSGEKPTCLVRRLPVDWPTRATRSRARECPCRRMRGAPAGPCMLRAETAAASTSWRTDAFRPMRLDHVFTCGSAFLSSRRNFARDSTVPWAHGSPGRTIHASDIVRSMGGSSLYAVKLETFRVGNVAGRPRHAPARLEPTEPP